AVTCSHRGAVVSFWVVRATSSPTPFPYTTLFRSLIAGPIEQEEEGVPVREGVGAARAGGGERKLAVAAVGRATGEVEGHPGGRRAEEHKAELQARGDGVGSDGVENRGPVGAAGVG